jgi:hypothetical protein
MFEYNVGLPLSPLSQKVDYESKSRADTEQRRALTLVLKQSAFIKEASKYEKSYNQSKNKTLLHYRDYLVSKAADAFVFNCQFTSSLRSNLTSQSKQVWATNSFDDIWDYIPPNPELIEQPNKYWGELGTLAFYIQYVDQGAYLPEVMQSTLRLIWSLLGTSYDLLPKERIRELKVALRLENSFLHLIKLKAEKLFSLTSQDENYFALQQARRQGLSINDYDLLQQRLFLGEYSSKVFEVLTPFLTINDNNKLSNIASSILSILKPAGFQLVLQAFIAEAYLLAAIALSNLDKEVQLTSLEVFQTTNTYNPIKEQIAGYFTLAYDAYSVLNIFSTRLEAPQALTELERDILSWLSSSGKIIGNDFDYRLSELL